MWVTVSRRNINEVQASCRADGQPDILIIGSDRGRMLFQELFGSGDGANKGLCLALSIGKLNASELRRSNQEKCLVHLAGVYLGVRKDSSVYMVDTRADVLRSH